MELNLKKEKTILPVWKPLGLTPLQTLNLLRDKLTLDQSEKLSYAGRLDPMAQGVMLVLVGDKANKNRSSYLNLPKTYIFEILIGVATDTGDKMGLPVNIDKPKEYKNLDLKKYTGSFIQDYPKYSSPIIAGKKTFSKQVKITKLSLLDQTKISWLEIIKTLDKQIGLVNGDFRQDQIIKAWHKINFSPDDQFSILRLEIESSSGVYVRLLAEKIAGDLGGFGLAWSITRVKVGNYGVDSCLKLS